MGVLVSSVTPTARAGAGELPPATPACGFPPLRLARRWESWPRWSSRLSLGSDTAIKSIKNPKTDPCERENPDFRRPSHGHGPLSGGPYVAHKVEGRTMQWERNNRPGFLAPSAETDGAEEERISWSPLFVSFKTMEPSMRVLAGLAIAQILVASILLAVKDVPTVRWYFDDLWPTFLFSPCHLRDNRVIPCEIGSIAPINIVVSYVFLSIGSALLLYGVMQAKWRGVVLFLCGLGAVLIAHLITAKDTGHFLVKMFVVGILCALLTCILLSVWRRGTLWLLLLMAFAWPFILWYAIDAPDSRLVIGTIFLFTFALIMWVLSYIFVLAAADWAEICDTASRWFTQRCRFEPSNYGLFQVIIATLACVWFSGPTDSAVIKGILAAAAPGLLLVVLLRFCDWKRDWPQEIEFGSLLVSSFLPPYLIIYLGLNEHHPNNHAAIIFLMIAVIFGVSLCVSSYIEGLASTLACLLFNYIMYAYLFWLALDVKREYMITIYVGALVTAAWLSYKQKSRLDITKPTSMLFAMIVAFVLFIEVFNLYNSINIAVEGARDTHEMFNNKVIDNVAPSVIVFIAMLWEFSTSGHSTNVGGKLFPRRSRYFIFFGYIGLVTAALIFSYSVRLNVMIQEPDQIKNLLESFNSDVYVHSGLIWIAPPFILTLFVLRWRRWLIQTREAGPRDQGFVVPAYDLSKYFRQYVTSLRKAPPTSSSSNSRHKPIRTALILTIWTAVIAFPIIVFAYASSIICIFMFTFGNALFRSDFSELNNIISSFGGLLGIRRISIVFALGYVWLVGVFSGLREKAPGTSRNLG